MTQTTNTSASDAPKTYTEAEVAELIKIATSKAREKKTHSEFFVTAERQPMSWRNLSETKRFMEINYPEILTTGMTSKSFHQTLVDKMGL